MRRPAKGNGTAVRRRLLPFRRRAPKEEGRPPSGSAGPPRGPVRRNYGKPLKIGSAPAKRRPVTPGEVVGKTEQASKKRK